MAGELGADRMTSHAIFWGATNEQRGEAACPGVAPALLALETWPTRETSQLALTPGSSEAIQTAIVHCNQRRYIIIMNQADAASKALHETIQPEFPTKK